VLQSDINRNTSQPDTLSELLFPLFCTRRIFSDTGSFGLLWHMNRCFLSRREDSFVQGRRFLLGVSKRLGRTESNCWVSSAVDGHETFFTGIERDMVSVVNVIRAMTGLHVGN
jgi:hypothetical protein